MLAVAVPLDAVSETLIIEKSYELWVMSYGCEADENYARIIMSCELWVMSFVHFGFVSLDLQSKEFGVGICNPFIFSGQRYWYSITADCKSAETKKNTNPL